MGVVVRASRVGVFLLSSLLLLFAPARPCAAGWSWNGNPMTRAPSAQNTLVLASDGAGGVIAAWDDSRSGNTINVFGQHFLADGSRAPGWAPNGDSLTQLPCNRRALAMIPDGSGGALLAWIDNACRNWQTVNANRITTSGAPAVGWPANGVPISDVGGDVLGGTTDPQNPAMASDGAGGAIITWSDNRTGYQDVYAHHITGAGSVDNAWPLNGLRLSTTEFQRYPSIASDGAGGAYIAWQDKRSGAWDIYVQRLTGSGTVSPGWPANGLAVCTAAGDQTAPALVADGAGQVFVAWQDARGGALDVYAQRLTSAGGLAPGWSVNGMPVCTSSGDQLAPVLALDGAGGSVVTWEDRRNGESDVFAVRLTGSGLPASGWAANGIAVCTAAGGQVAPQISGDGSGGGFIVWEDSRDGSSHIYGQHLDALGQVVTGWTPGGQAVCTAAGVQKSPHMAADGSGGAIVGWVDTRSCNATASDIYARRLAPQGPVGATVSGLHAQNRSGQTFLTWTSPSGDGWTYRVYASPSPISSPSDLGIATLLGAVRDSTWYDRRLSVLTGLQYRFSIDSLAAPLAPSQGLFVATPVSSGAQYYAVTAGLGDCGENPILSPGVNALASPVAEQVASPVPVFQRTLPRPGYPSVDIYTLWTSDRATPLFAAMANRAGLAYDCGLIRGGAPPLNSLMLALHARGGDFLSQSYPISGYPGEWVLALDDYLPTADVATYWYGYHESYDVTLWTNPVPTTGTVRDYTLQRVIHTLQWARRHLPVDTTRVYAYGVSMGGIGSELLGLREPQLIAASMLIVPKFDFSFLNDPNPLNAFNLGAGLRQSVDRLWGQVATDLPSSEGWPIFDALNDGFMVHAKRSMSLPPIIAFNGRWDTTVGWAEKIPFYGAVRDAQESACFYWDPRDHLGSATAAWAPLQNPSYLHRFRTNLSFPALSHCSADNDPGDGTVASGDSVGCINGYVQWDTLFVDQADAWQTTLSLRDLPMLSGTAVSPESLTADVTPRRTQAFRPAANTVCSYEVVRVANGTLVMKGIATSDSLGLVTVPAVKIYRSGSRLRLTALGLAAVQSPPVHLPAWPVLQLPANPLRGAAHVIAIWPLAGEARLELYDVSGRRERRLVSGPVRAGTMSVSLQAGELPAGVHFMEAWQQGMRTVVRMVVLR